MKISDIIIEIERFAPKIYQEAYDNAGLLVGNTHAECTGVLICLDTLETVIDEAIAKKANLVLAHHPIIFSGLKSITGKNYIERTVLKAIKNDIAIYAAHTNLDNVYRGVNFKMAQKIGLIDHSVLMPKTTTLFQLAVFVPKTHSESLAEAMHLAGAGHIGNYDSCHFALEGIGQFRPLSGANPTIGQTNMLEKVEETQLSFLVPSAQVQNVLAAMHKNHPYETVAYFLTQTTQNNQNLGTGLVGLLPEPMPTKSFLGFIKSTFNCGIIKHTAILKDEVQKIAVVGGSGSFALAAAKAQNADVLITADFKYHEYFDAENKTMVMDIGHYESEQFTNELFFEILSEKFTNFAVHLSETRTNPVFYY